MISWSSSTASSAPATSAKVVFGVSLLTSLALDLPNCMTREPPPCIWLKRNRTGRPGCRIGSRVISRLTDQDWLRDARRCSRRSAGSASSSVDDLAAAGARRSTAWILVAALDLPSPVLEGQLDPLVAVDDLGLLDLAVARSASMADGGVDLLEPAGGARTSR